MEDIIETIKYKNCVIEICQDESAESPDERKDEDLFLVHYHRDFEVKRDEIITESETGAILTGDYERFDDGSGYFKNNCKEIKRKEK